MTGTDDSDKMVHPASQVEAICLMTGGIEPERLCNSEGEPYAPKSGYLGVIVAIATEQLGGRKMPNLTDFFRWYFRELTEPQPGDKVALILGALALAVLWLGTHSFS